MTNLNIDSEAATAFRQALTAQRTGDQHAVAAAIVDIDAASFEAIWRVPVLSITTTARLAFRQALAAARAGDDYHVAYHLVDIDSVSWDGIGQRLVVLDIDLDDLLGQDSHVWWQPDTPPRSTPVTQDGHPLAVAAA
jgi:hypothetical protein